MFLTITKNHYNPNLYGARKKNVDEDLSKKLIPYIESNTPYEQVIEETGIQKKTLNEWAKRNYNKSFKQLYNTEINKTMLETIMAMKKAGATLEVIAKTFGHSIRWVSNRFRDFGILKKYEERDLKLEKEIPDLINKGYTISKMSELVGEPKTVISQWINRKYGKTLIEIRESKKIHICREKERYEDLKSTLSNLFENGYSIKEVSEKTGMSRAMISHWVDKFNIPTKMRESKKRLEKVLIPMMARGYTLKEISETVGLTTFAIHRRIKALFNLSYKEAQKQVMKTFFH